MRLSGQEIIDAYYSGKDLRGAVAQYSRWLGSTFIGCDLSNSALGEATFDRCRFVDCTFTNAILVSRIYRCSFEACDFDEAKFIGSDVQDCKFVRSRAQRSDWSRATVMRTLLDVDFRGANLNFALTQNVDFRGANLWSALLPFNCAGFTTNTFADREIQMFLCLLGQTTTPMAKALEKLVRPWYRGMFGRLMRLQG